MTTIMSIDGGWTDSGGRPASATYDPAAGKVLEQALEATTEDVDAAVRAADRAYWDHVAEVFGRRCSANWTDPRPQRQVLPGQPERVARSVQALVVGADVGG